MSCAEQVPSVDAGRGLISVEADCSSYTSLSLQVSNFKDCVASAEANHKTRPANATMLSAWRRLHRNEFWYTSRASWTHGGLDLDCRPSRFRAIIDSIL
jgi:hypothetical protein